MPANTNPIFVLTPNCHAIGLSAANTASDGSGTIATLFTPGANGSRVDQIVYRNAQQTPAASSAMVGRIFISDDGGTTWRLIQEVAIPAATRTASTVGATSTITFSVPLLLLSTQRLGATQSVYAGAQDANTVTVYGGDF